MCHFSHIYILIWILCSIFVPLKILGYLYCTCDIIVYEMYVLFFKMAADLRTWDANCETALCDSVVGHIVCGNMRRYRANEHVWEEITNFINARLGKAFTVRRIRRMWKHTRRNYKRLMVDRTRALGPNVSPVSCLDRLSDDPPQ